MNAAETIRAARLAAGITQDDLAALSGVRQPNIAAYESGKRVPSQAMLDRLVSSAKPRPSVLLRRYSDEVSRIVAAHRGRNVRVFGSVARGTDTPSSDVDLLVTLLPGASLFDMVRMTDELEQVLGTHVDVVSERGLTERDEEIRAEAKELALL